MGKAEVSRTLKVMEEAEINKNPVREQKGQLSFSISWEQNLQAICSCASTTVISNIWHPQVIFELHPTDHDHISIDIDKTRRSCTGLLIFKELPLLGVSQAKQGFLTDFNSRWRWGLAWTPAALLPTDACNRIAYRRCLFNQIWKMLTQWD